jgi:hypothetical protein
LLAKNLDIRNHNFAYRFAEVYNLVAQSEEHRIKAFRIFEPKRDEVTREWRNLHNGELNDLYSSSKIVRVIRSRRMRCIAYGGEERRIQGFGGET